jgi:hypothetical protein
VNSTTKKSELYRAWMQEVPAHLKDHDGIKCQLAAAAHLVTHLDARGCGWTFKPTTPGSPEDLRGIDGYLENDNYVGRIPVDFSLESEDNPAGHKKDQVWLVHLRRDWFGTGADGSVQLLTGSETRFFRSFLPVLQAGMALLAAA